MKLSKAQNQRDKFVKIDGLKIRYRDEGYGRPIVLLHGGAIGTSLEIFETIIPSLIENGYRCISFDQPGFGMSEIPLSDRKATRSYRNQVTSKLMKKLKLSDVVLVGHSQGGGNVGQIILDKNPLCTAAIFLCAGICLPPSERFKPGAIVDRHRNFLVEPDRKDIIKFLEYNLYNHDLITDELIENRLKYSIGDKYEYFVRFRKIVPDVDYYMWAKFITVDVPMMFIFGASDNVRDDAKIRLMKLRALYPYGRFTYHLFEKCKHYPHWDQPELTVSTVLNFLQKHPKTVV